jgi:hypothetical protein
MIYRITLASMLLLAFLFAPAGAGYGQVAAQESATTAFDLSNLPPGIAKKVAPLLDELMMHPHHMMGMGHECTHHGHHMGQIEEMIDQLPPGILVQILDALLQLNMMQMMDFHDAVEDGLLDQPPGQILKTVQGLVR